MLYRNTEPRYPTHEGDSEALHMGLRPFDGALQDALATVDASPEPLWSYAGIPDLAPVPRKYLT